MQDCWLLFPGLCLNRTAIQWISCCLFAFLCFGEWFSESRFGMVCTFLLLKPPRVIWSLDAVLAVRKKHLLSFSVFLVSLALFLRGASCKSCLMHFGTNSSQFQTEIVTSFLSSCECNHTWENQLHRNDFWGMSPQCDCRCACLFVVLAGQETVALISWMIRKVKMKPGNVLLLSLTAAVWLLSPAPALQWCSLKGCAGAAEYQDAVRSPGKLLLGEVQHKSRTGESLAKPALGCHTPGLQINMGAGGQPGRRGGNRSVAHHSKLGQQQGGC